eukprot:15057407-Heterocapsa_arctica.AAC.1
MGWRSADVGSRGALVYTAFESSRRAHYDATSRAVVLTAMADERFSHFLTYLTRHGARDFGMEMDHY